MKRKLITLLIILVCFLLESSFFHRLSFASVKPNLLIVVTSSFGFMRGKKEGMCRTVGRSVLGKCIRLQYAFICCDRLHERFVQENVL